MVVVAENQDASPGVPQDAPEEKQLKEVLSMLSPKAAGVLNDIIRFVDPTLSKHLGELEKNIPQVEEAVSRGLEAANNLDVDHSQPVPGVPPAFAAIADGARAITTMKRMDGVAAGGRGLMGPVAGIADGLGNLSGNSPAPQPSFAQTVAAGYKAGKTTADLNGAKTAAEQGDIGTAFSKFIAAGQDVADLAQNPASSKVITAVAPTAVAKMTGSPEAGQITGEVLNAAKPALDAAQPVIAKAGVATEGMAAVSNALKVMQQSMKHLPGGDFAAMLADGVAAAGSMVGSMGHDVVASIVSNVHVLPDSVLASPLPSPVAQTQAIDMGAGRQA